MQGRRAPIDALKLIGSQFIVWHHFAAYGPVADAVGQTAPALIGWLYEYARMAVQIFLVLSGYLAVQSLAPGGAFRPVSLAQAVWQRYLRLVGPYGAALLLALAAAAVARHGLDADFIPAAPTWGQLLAHVLLLQGVLGTDVLSAGVWYVAIDFQLFALMALLLWLGQAQRRQAQALVLGLMLVSLFVFNRDERWDNWALYFFGAYGMGAAAYWAATSRRPLAWLAALLLTGMAALLLEFRERIALAWAVALLLGVLRWYSPAWPEFTLRGLRLAGRISYALFLVHFPVLMLGNWLFVQLGMSGPLAGGVMLLLIWGVSLVAAWGFERTVEAPLARRYQRRHGLHPA